MWTVRIIYQAREEDIKKVGPSLSRSLPRSFLIISLENEAENTYPHEETCYIPAEKRARAKAFVAPQFHNEDRVVELERSIQRFQEEIHFLKWVLLFVVLSSLTFPDRRENLERKDEQIQNISNENAESYQRCETFADNNSKLLEENRILKRAVGIQESRLREVQSQSQQMQELMNQAADYIAGLERANAALKHRVECNDSKSYFSSEGPPDVY
jgi:DNA repair exonuclease SbcCD ATPase subunit